MPNNDKAPNYNAFHISVSNELYSVKDRIRNLVSHWPTDGEHKEVALRSVLRRHLPASVIVGRGFIVTADDSSTQIDILIIDSSKPTLFKEGDLLIVTPDAVLAIIEVKTELTTMDKTAEVIEKLSRIEAMCCKATGKDSVWTGLFTYSEENPLSHQSILSAVGAAYVSTRYHINCVSIGRSRFVRYWSQGSAINSNEQGAVWHSYELEGVAPSYFMGNLIDSIYSVDHSTSGFAWFPTLGGKEQHRKYYLSVGRNNPIPY